MTWTHGASGYRNYACRCDVCRQAWVAYHREWRRKHVAKGLCVRCGQPSESYRCPKHAASHAAAQK